MTIQRPRSIRSRRLPVVQPGGVRGGSLLRLGIGGEDWDYIVALAGNPNTGKSTVFNALTGLRQHVGNWPGKTVTRAEGGYAWETDRYKVVDLPGTYSLLSASTDEEIARDFILFGRPDCTIIVMDATLLERNLNLALQILEITDRAVVCLNLMDEARRKGIKVNHKTLARDLGVPVIPTVARTKHGMDDLVRAVAGVARGDTETNPHRIRASGKVAQAVDELAMLISEALPSLPNARWIAMRLLEGDRRVEEAIQRGELGAREGASAEPVGAKAEAV